MCGIAVIAGPRTRRQTLEDMIAVQSHRGPDAQGVYVNSDTSVGLGHARLSILDLTSSGAQPMSSPQGRSWIVFNGEVYNYIELREELRGYPFSSQTDTEVILAAYEKWGVGALERLEGMFAFALWDSHTRQLLVARDRFGVKPVYYKVANDGTLLLASEIKALHVAGVPAQANQAAWATYLLDGLYDHDDTTFWKDVKALPAGSYLTWNNGRLSINRWYDLAKHSGEEYDSRPIEEVESEYWGLLQDSVRKRFRSDVPVGINLSGGLDSSLLLGLVQDIQGADSDVQAYTFVTGDARYDEIPWVQQMLDKTQHPSTICQLRPQEVPELAESVQAHQDEPFGGLPTLAYAKLFAAARQNGTTVLLDGQGMDEQWAGYDYYANILSEGETVQRMAGPVQGTRQRTTRSECLTREFRCLAQEFSPPKPYPDALRNAQIRDTCHAKIPRALRFNDRISMRSSVELREPFLDHRLFELALRQPPDRKVRQSSSKWLLRHLATKFLPFAVATTPKRPLQTPQREWLRDELRDWANDCIEDTLRIAGGTWLDCDAVRSQWQEYQSGTVDSSFHIWQWISIALVDRVSRKTPNPNEVVCRS